MENLLLGVHAHGARCAIIFAACNKSIFRPCLPLPSSLVKLTIHESLTIRPVARKGYGSIAHEAKPNGLLIRGP